MSWAGVTSFGGGKRDEENENDSNLHDLELENGQRDIDGAVSIGEVGGPARFRHIKNRKYMRRLYLVLAALAAIFVFSSLLRVSMRSKRSPSSRGFDLDLAGTSLREEHALIFMYDATRTSMSAGDLADLKDAKTPQRKALQWLANEDKLQIEIPKNFNDEIHEAFSQRYSVAVLAFAWGENVLRPLGFLSGKSECDWNTDFQRPDISTLKMGIICDDQGKRVEKIVLQTLGLTGELPTELGNLVDLTRIHLDGNNFQGQIGPQFHRLSNLRDLTITRNQLTGRLPAFFGRLNNLHHVELSFNQLSGSISSGFHEGSGNNDATVDGGQSQIQILGLDHNKFSGSLDSVEKLSSLQELYLNDNKLTGRVVDHFKGFKNLGILDLSSNKLEGKIPDYLLELDRLAIADLHSNKFDGQFPHGNSTQLHYLDVHDNEISMLPGSIGKHANLAYLDLSKNTFEELPAEVAQLTKLEYLFLAENEKLEPGSIPEWLNDLPRLSAVSFKDTNRIGELPHWLWRLDQLTMLDLEGNNINGTILRQLHKMTSLEYLFLNRNELSGNVPDTLGNMTSLKLLNVDHNKLTGQIEDTICAMDLEVLVADCLVSETRTQPQIECGCCTKCCDPDIDQCNTRDWSKDYGENSWGGYYIRYNILDEGDVYKQVQINAEKNGSD